MRRYSEPHPLEEITLAAFTQRDCHDSTSLGWYMADAIPPHVASRRAVRDHIKQAAEVLKHMEWNGKVQRDKYGWYHLNKHSNQTIGEFK